MKKIAIILMSVMMIFSFVACASNGQNEVTNNSSTEPSQKSEQTPSENIDEGGTLTTNGGKTLVVYFSATGNTETVAKYIAAATNGELFEIEPSEPYKSDDLNWNDDNSRVVREHDNPDDRNVALVASTVENWADYDTVCIGYPIWWSIAAWPVDTFVKANDFTGKTVVPFCTSSSSALGESGTLLRDMAGTGNWIEGNRFSSNVSESDVQAWVAELGLQ